MFIVNDSEVVDCGHEHTLLFISVDANVLVVEDDPLYLNPCR